MISADSLSWLVIFILGLPAALLCTHALLLSFGVKLSERLIARLHAWVSLILLLLSLSLGAGLLLHEKNQLSLSLGHWFVVGHYRFPLEILVDSLSLTFLLLVVGLTGLVARFSSSYLHRESGFQRFFLLFSLFLNGMLWIVLAGTVELLFLGWELVGLSSALLIAFFQQRREPLLNGLHAFGVYRLTDVGLLAATVLLHQFAHTAEWDVAFGQSRWPEGTPLIDGFAVHAITFLFLLAALGKSAQIPFSHWLPRAMEGPTPSSAVFYGGISIHAGAYLLLRAAPLIDRSPFGQAAIFSLGLLTAVWGSWMGRVQADAKNQLAYASMSQVGLIFVEIALGLRFLAILHIAGHATIRTLQFLKAPSVLQQLQRLEADHQGGFQQEKMYYEMLLPDRFRQRFYSFSLQSSVLTDEWRKKFIQPFWQGLLALDQREQSFARLFIQRSQSLKQVSSTASTEQTSAPERAGEEG